LPLIDVDGSYVTPEKLAEMANVLPGLVKRGIVRCIAIDECHLVSDFE
jgi:hypothetical protein